MTTITDNSIALKGFLITKHILRYILNGFSSIYNFMNFMVSNQWVWFL